MFGRRPAATAEKITSSDAPSSISIRTFPPGMGAALSFAAGITAGTSGCRAGPRATIGAVTDATIVSDRIAPLIGPPRRPRCESPRPRKITDAAVTLDAPMNIRSRVT